MSAANQPDPAGQASPTDQEFEMDLTSETELEPDQRSHERREASSSLAGTIEFRDETFTVRIDDLSIGGAGVSMPTNLPLRTECKLTIQLSVCGSDYELAMKCRVSHCDAVNSKTYEAGLQFIEMTPGTRDTLLLLVR
jgi:c-di-GMP-binding flagellar brake protein YcgR